MGVVTDSKIHKLNSIVNENYNRITFYENDLSDQIEEFTRYNSDGSLNKAPSFSKRGHIAELMHQYTFMINNCVALNDSNRFAIASDKVGINTTPTKRNDPLTDIVLYDRYEGTKQNYQSKVYKTPYESLKAATAPKYVEGGVIPLIPENNVGAFDKITVGTGKNAVSSDSVSVEKLDRIVDLCNRGYKVNPVSGDKIKKLYANAMRKSITTSMISSLQTQTASSILRAVTSGSSEINVNNELKNIAKNTLISMAKSGIATSASIKTGSATWGTFWSNTIVNSVQNVCAYCKGEISKGDLGRAILSSAAKAGGEIAVAKVAGKVFKAVPFIAKLAAPIVIVSLLFGKKEMTEEEWENERARELERIEREEEEAVGQLYAEILAQMNKYSDQLRNLYSSIVPRLIQRSADYGSFFDEVNAGQTASAFAPFKIHYKAEMPQILSELTDEPKNFVSVKKIRNLMR